MQLDDLKSDVQDRTTSRRTSRVSGLNAIKNNHTTNENNAPTKDNVEQTTETIKDAPSASDKKTDEPVKKTVSKALPGATKYISEDKVEKMVKKEKSKVKASDDYSNVIFQNTGVMTKNMVYYHAKPKEKRTQRIGYVVEPSRYEAFKQCCSDNGYSMNDVISSFMESFVKQHGYLKDNDEE